MPQKRILPYVIMGILLNKDCTGKQGYNPLEGDT